MSDSPASSPWKLNLVMLGFSQILVMIGYSAMNPFISLFMKDELHISEANGDLAFYFGVFNVLTALAYAMFCPLWGRLADRFGVKVMLLRGTFVTAFIFPMMAYVSNVWLLILLRFLSAACAGTTAASHIMIARETPDNKQGFAQGVLTTAIWGGAMLGLVVGGLTIHHFSYKVTFWVCGILYFIAGFSILFTREKFKPVRKTCPEKPVRKEAHTFRERVCRIIPAFTKAVWLMFFLMALGGLVRSVEVPFIALRVESLCEPGKAAYWTGIVSAVVSCGAIVSGVVGGYLSDKLSPRTLLIPIILIASVSMILQGAVENLLIFTISRTLLYVVAGGIHPILQKILSGVTPARKRGAVFGFASTSGQLGIMLASALGSAVYYLWNNDVRGVFYVGGILMCLSLPVFLWCLSRVMSQKFYRLYTLKHAAEQK